MGQRELKDTVEQQYFEPAAVPVSEDEGTRDMKVLYPFLISGGANTERWYFVHINDLTEFKFNIKPEYFSDESNYTEVFPKRINDILSRNIDAKIFCVFDWDTVYGNDTREKKHKSFLEQFKTQISAGVVTVCPSMPSIEYWFLLHFVNHTDLMKDYREVSNVLAPYMKPCFSNPSEKLKKLLKKRKFLEDASWVKRLCSNGSLSDAIKRAEDNINMAEAEGVLQDQSYSYVYKVFKFWQC